MNDRRVCEPLRPYWENQLVKATGKAKGLRQILCMVIIKIVLKLNSWMLSILINKAVWKNKVLVNSLWESVLSQNITRFRGLLVLILLIHPCAPLVQPNGVDAVTLEKGKNLSWIRFIFFWDGIFFASLDKIFSSRSWAGVEGLRNLTVFHPLNIDMIGIYRPVLMSRAEPPTLWHSPSSTKYSEYWKAAETFFYYDCFKTGNKSAPKSDDTFWWPLTWLPVLMRREPVATLRHSRSSEKLPPSSRIARWHVNFAAWDIFAFAMRSWSLSTCCATQEGWHFSQMHGG